MKVLGKTPYDGNGPHLLHGLYVDREKVHRV